MEPLLDWGIRVVLWLQQFSPALDGPFKALSFLGEETFFMLILPLIFWCLDRRSGVRLTILFLVSTYLGSAIKQWVYQPRPFEYDPDVQALESITSRGFPSLHTQNTVVIWGYLASYFRRRWLWILTGVLVVLVPLSRLYLGVHFPTDLVGGYFFGLLLLGGVWEWEDAIERWLSRLSLRWQVGLPWGIGLIGTALLLPVLDESIVTACAMMAGMGGGIALERRWVGFEVEGALGVRLVRFAIGVLGLFILRLGLGALFSELEPAFAFRFVRYVLIGLWGALGAPWLFVQLRLAKASLAPVGMPPPVSDAS